MSLNGTSVVKSGGTLRFEDSDNTHSTSIVAGNQTSNINYTLPAAEPISSNRFLKATGTSPSFTMEWSNPGSEVVYEVTSPAAIGGSGDLTISASGTMLRLSTSGAGPSYDINGLSSSGVASGRVVVLVNVGTISLKLKHQSSATPANRIILPGGGDIVIGPDGTATLVYDGTSQRWRLISSN
ncbi:MAG: hypothetical protein FGM32_04295 [Candidatus Kapabacteria bacterium]|nr:hypothetical protein [Candidatus Kapabacteria bacterium]